MRTAAPKEVKQVLAQGLIVIHGQSPQPVGLSIHLR
jgi:hypothetical protein